MIMMQTSYKVLALLPFRQQWHINSNALRQLQSMCYLSYEGLL